MTMAASLSASLQRRQADEMLDYRASHDLLTGLPNRLLFDRELALSLKSSYQQIHRQNSGLGVLFLDLNQFKAINDSLGHTFGDLLLKSVADRLQEVAQPDQVVARWGGDEFTILLPQITHEQEAVYQAQNFLQAFDSIFQLADATLYVSASIGITCHFPTYGHAPIDSETLIRQADTALYQAKRKGHNTYQVYKASMNVKTPELLILEQRLRLALDNQEFMVVYQPQIHVMTGQMIGVEALLRWCSSDRGEISPGVFVPIAEETGLIVPIGEWVLRQACQQYSQWQQLGLSPLRIGVNLSPKQFRQLHMVETIAQVLQETNMDPNYLELEITESMAIEDFEFTYALMQDLNHLGIKLSLDDFGTGHSSLSRLQFLPLDSLKIDQSFIRDLSRNPKSGHIVTAIIALGRSLGLEIIAEGVESKEQLEFLRSLNCNYVQGFYFHRPLKPEQITVLLRQGGRSSNGSSPSSTL